MKRKITALILSVLMLITFAACNTSGGDGPGNDPGEIEEARTLNLITGKAYKSEDYPDTYDTLVEVSYPSVSLYYGDENNFPELQKSLENASKESKDKMIAFMEENIDYAAELYEADSFGYMAFQSQEDVTVRRADTLVTSILFFGNEYLAGYHERSYKYGRNYDTNTGEELKLTDVVTDMDKLEAAVYKQIENSSYKWELDGPMTVGQTIRDEKMISWTLDYNGITLYFNPYTVSTYKVWVQQVTIGFDQYPEVIKEEYKLVTESYGVQLDSMETIFYDVTGDGKLDEILFSGNPSMDGDIGNVCITLNGQDYDFPQWYYEGKGTFVHTADGKNYILVEVVMENDYRETHCYAISDSVQHCGTADGGLRRIYHESEDFMISQDVLSNPEQFYFQKTTQVLSTVTGQKECYLDANGIPVSDDVLYEFDEERMFTLTLKDDFTADVYDIKTGEITGEKILKAGEQVLYYSTDGEDLALLKCSDGTICAVDVILDDENYYLSIDGEDIESIFDGILFAG